MTTAPPASRGQQTNHTSFSNIPLHIFQANLGLAFFHQNWVIPRLWDLLLQEGIPDHYPDHYFRRGAAAWAKRVGIPDEDVQLPGR